MKNILRTLISIFALALASCATMNQMAGLGVVKEQRSDFDNTRIVSVSPNFMGSTKIFSPCFLKIGMVWAEDDPDNAILTLTYESDVNAGSRMYTSFTSLGINIDGRIKYFKPASTRLDSSSYNTVSKTIYTSSKSHVVVPLSYVKQMVNGRDVRVQASGFRTGLFHQESNSGAPLAKKNFKEGLAKIGR